MKSERCAPQRSPPTEGSCSEWCIPQVRAGFSYFSLIVEPHVRSIADAQAILRIFIRELPLQSTLALRVAQEKVGACVMLRRKEYSVTSKYAGSGQLVGHAVPELVSIVAVDHLHAGAGDACHRQRVDTGSAQLADGNVPQGVGHHVI